MKRKIDFFDVFRESGRHLQITPSGAAWNKLERRLEAQKKRRRRLQIISITGIAATILLLVVLAALIPVLSHRQVAGDSGTLPQGVIFEARTSVSATDLGDVKAVEFSRINALQFASVEEGAPEKDLIVNAQIRTAKKADKVKISK